MESLWREQAVIEKRKPLQGDLETDTLVIGAGMAGILTAYFLQKQNREVIVIEAKQIASGQTERTTAKITSQHGAIYDKFIRKIGINRAKIYAQANEEAIRAYEKIVTEEQIDCDFEKLPSYLYTREEEGIPILEKETAAAEKVGIKAYFIPGEAVRELPLVVKGAVCFENQAQFHPLKFIRHLAAGLTIHENTKVLAVKKHKVFTERGTIVAKNIVFATHYPFANIPGFYFLRQHQERSYVMELDGQMKLSGMYYSIDKKGLSFRSTEEKLLVGGGNHRTGKKLSKKSCNECGQHTGGGEYGYTFLRQMVQKYYPKAKAELSWSAQDCMSHDEIPFIGKYSVFRSYWHVATGFNKWGMTSAMVAAMIISCRISGKESLYEKVFSPQRFHFRAAIKNLLVDIGESVLGLGKGLFSKRRRRCPHMGCRLKWNPQEKSWDCPCHGSRFDGTGELLDNPAQIDLRE